MLHLIPERNMLMKVARELHSKPGVKDNFGNKEVQESQV